MGGVGGVLVAGSSFNKKKWGKMFNADDTSNRTDSQTGKKKEKEEEEKNLKEWNESRPATPCGGCWLGTRR